MKIQSTLIIETSPESVLIEMLLADSADAEVSGGEFLKVRLSIPYPLGARVAGLQAIALRQMQPLINEQIQETQSVLSQVDANIPQWAGGK